MQDAPPLPRPAILITGGTGFLGSALVRQLLRDGEPVIVSTRDAMQARRKLGPGVRVVDTLDAIAPDTRMDAIVHLAGAAVVGQPWTRARREVLVRSRTGTMQSLLALIGRLREPPRVLVAASGVGFYGVPAQAVDESSPPQPGRFQSDLCAAAEREAQYAEALGVRVVRMRFGIVLGPGGGAYPGLALASRLGLGSVLGDGRQPVPWIHLEDAIGLLRFALARPDVAGAVNAVAPEVPDQATFARTMAQALHRRAWLRTPGWVLRLGMGEMAELLLCGQRVVPAAALGAGYGFRHPALRAALDDLAAARATSAPAV